MKFDSTIIESFARRLYARASWVVLRYWFLYTMVGGIAAATCYYYLPAQVAQNLGAFIVLGTLVCFGLVGIAVGNEKAFHLRLQAQMALCQIQIERNTRAAAAIDSVADALDPRPQAAVHLKPTVGATGVGS
jgi:hypothetical protein